MADLSVHEAMGILYSASRINPKIGCEQRFIAYHDGDVEKALGMAIKALANGWIPVSEGLPETGWYLVTFKTADGGYAVCELGFRKPEGYWTDRDITRKSLISDDVVAWMPKPKPYRA